MDGHFFVIPLKKKKKKPRHTAGLRNNDPPESLSSPRTRKSSVNETLPFLIVHQGEGGLQSGREKSGPLFHFFFFFAGGSRVRLRPCHRPAFNDLFRKPLTD